ncbi:hypothetical protein FB451DRAFT_1384756 [Mycena latifolia]|nr:hypothetical protein FB451DRAFT_1384756 [Mycena latifolia]
MADHPTLTSSLLNNRRRRAMIACTNCRKRKIKCVTSEEPPRNPCARCTKRSLPCEYVSVEEDSPTESPLSLPPGSYPPSYPSSTPYGGGSIQAGYIPYPPSSQYSVPWEAPQQHNHSHSGYPIPAQNGSYRSQSSYGPGPGPMFGAPAGYPTSSGQYYQQHPFPAAPPPNQWAQGSAQQLGYASD